MSNQLRFEGNDLEQLLARVRAEAGDHARIIAANRVRKGGVGGFFARELFEVIIEPAVDVEEDLRPAARFGRTRKEAMTTADAPVNVTTALRVESVLDLVDEVETVERSSQDIDLGHTIDLGRMERHAAALPEVSTQTERFAEILERLAISTETQPTGREADHRTATGNHNDTWVNDTSASDISVVDDYERPVARAVETTLYRATSAAVQQAVPLETPPEPAAPIEVAQVQQDEPTVRVAPIITKKAPDPRYRREYAPATISLAVTEDDELIERPEGALVRLGVPARLIPRGVAGLGLHEALAESLERLPTPEQLPATRGVTVAIVGIGARPVALARILAVEQDIDPDTVVIATERELGNGVPAWLQITDATSALERRRSWRRRDHVSFVAVSMPSMTAATEWANTMLDYLEPTQIWAVANAGWKAEDVRAWASHLGGFDVLAIERLDDTISPASLLDIGIPVARIDGEPASAQNWADLLVDRLVVL